MSWYDEWHTGHWPSQPEPAIPANEPPLTVERLAAALHTASVDCNPLLPMTECRCHEGSPRLHMNLHRDNAAAILAALAADATDADQQREAVERVGKGTEGTG